jgi:rhodanese-related sulfurtransferase
MKKLFLVTLFIPLVFAISCKKVTVDPPTTDPFKEMTDYMVKNNMDLPNILNDWIVAPPKLADVQTFIGSYDIIDIRDKTHFDLGHIEGAVNSTLANILNTAANTTKEILVVCYTGQSAAHAVVALRLSGYDAKVLTWGMSGWRADMAKPWEDNSGPVNGVNAIGHTNWVATNTTPVSTFNTPDLTLSGSGAEMLKTRVKYMLDNGFKGIPANDVLNDPTKYFINNYWAEGDVTHYGHINTAYRINPISIANGEIKNLDATKTIVTYCWTGQTSSMVTAYLNVIGYNALSLKFGTNCMIYSALTSHKFVTPSVDLPVVPT